MKQFIPIVLSVLLLFSTILPFQQIEAAYSFYDVPFDYRYAEEITDMASLGIIKGYEDKTFRPSKTMTRGQVAVMIDRAIDLEPIREQIVFTDVPTTHRYYNEIQALYRAGIADGSNGKFHPEDSLTRGQLSKILSNAFNLPLVMTASFQDVSLKNGYNQYIGALKAAEITTGDTDGTFKPNGTLSRQHFAVFMHRAMIYFDPNAFTIPEMAVHFIDVGQGDSILLQSPNGKTMLIDGGAKFAGSNVVNYLQAQGIQRLDYVVATHPDADHIGGLIDVLQTFTIGEFINSGKSHTSETYQQLLTIINDKNIPYSEPSEGEVILSDQGINVKVLYADAAAADNNDASIVLRAAYNNVSFLLMGDADGQIEEQLLTKYNMASTILKAGHHGSDTSSSRSFLQEVKPEATIFSYGEANSYGHPHDTVVANVTSVGSKIYSTAQEGTISVTTNGRTFDIEAKEFTAEPVPSPGTEMNAYANCTDLRIDYPNGVSSSHPAYQAKMDRDGDGWACEK